MIAAIWAHIATLREKDVYNYLKGRKQNVMKISLTAGRGQEYIFASQNF